MIDVPMKPLEFELNWQWLLDSIGAIWRPLLLGCVICGLFFGSMGFFIVSMLWRWRVVSRWKKRIRRRKRKIHS